MTRLKRNYCVDLYDYSMSAVYVIETYSRKMSMCRLKSAFLKNFVGALYSFGILSALVDSSIGKLVSVGTYITVLLLRSDC